MSSWNDHGLKELVSDATRLMRSDFFPGLGWMTRRDIWDSIKAKWCAMAGAGNAVWRDEVTAEGIPTL